jgi:hypothetical protein
MKVKTLERDFTLDKIAIIIKMKDQKFWWECGEKGMLWGM